MAKAERPVSPHLQIYRWYLTMALSIGHRITGLALSFGLILLTWWLLALASGPEAFALVERVKDSVLGTLVLIGYTAVIFYHLCNGIRHLIWDCGIALDPLSAHRSGQAVLAATGVLTLLTWLIIAVAS
jgi:succinate dehydrogenase / fumarate reductase cytochrome b subunit